MITKKAIMMPRKSIQKKKIEILATIKAITLCPSVKKPNNEKMDNCIWNS